MLEFAEVMPSPPPQDQSEQIGPRREDDSSPADFESVRAPKETLDSQTEITVADGAGPEVALADQSAASKKRSGGRSSKRQEIRSELLFMMSANREAGGAGVYSGFRFVRSGAAEMNADEAPYLGAFLPLRVAAKYPGLLAFKTISYEDVFANEQLPGATRTVVRPGKFIRYGIINFVVRLTSYAKSAAYLAGMLIAVAVFAWVVMKFKRFR